jgi:hypothetical protein
MMEPDGAPLALSFDVCCNKMCMLCRKHYAKLLLMVSIWFHANDDNYSQILFAMSTNKNMCFYLFLIFFEWKNEHPD